MSGGARRVHQMDQVGALVQDLATVVVAPFYHRLIDSGVTDRAATVLAGRLQDALVFEMLTDPSTAEDDADSR